MLFALVAASAVFVDSDGWSHRRINHDAYEIFGPAQASDADRMAAADRLCPKTGWESDSTVRLTRGGDKLRWRIVCRGR